MQSSCRLQLHTLDQWSVVFPASITTQIAAQYSGGDLLKSDDGSMQDIGYNGYGIDVANTGGPYNSCILGCKQRCTEDAFAKCCNTNLSLNKTDPDCLDPCPSTIEDDDDGIGNLCSAQCGEHAKGTFAFDRCYYGCRRKLSGLGNEFDISN